MATIRISQLPSITGANTAVDDTVPIVDTSLNVTNKITRQEFFLNTPNIGLNTSTPDALLTVNGVASFSDGSALAPSIANSGDLNTGIFFPAEDTIAFAEGGVERVRFDSSGNIGVGTSTPTFTSGSGLEVQRTDAVTTVRIERIGLSPSAMEVRSGASLGEVAVVSNNPLLFSTNNTERMRIHSTGGVSVGNTTDPGATNLSVTGSVTTGTVTNAGTVNVSATGANSVTLSTAGVERFRAGPAGQFGIAGANYGTAGHTIVSAGPSAAPSWGQLGLTSGVTGTLPLGNGGTGVTTAPAAAAVLYGFTTTATAAGVTTLTNTSSQYQLFTGTTTQTVTLPVASTLTTGWTFHIVNSSTGNLTINSSGGNLVATVIPGTTVMVTCILNSGTTAASWEYGYTDFNTLTGTGSVVMSVAPTLITPNLGTGSFDLGAVATPSITFTGDPNTGLWSPAADTIAVSTNGSERARVHASGGVSIGNTTDPGATNLSVTGSVAASTVSTPTVTTAGTLSVSATGANIVNISTNGVVRRTYNTDGNQVFFQGAPTVIAAPATLTAAQLATGIIQYTGIAGNLTLPLGTALDTYYSANVDMAFDFSIINTSAAIVTIAVNTGVTSLGALATAASTSSRWRLRRTAANTWVIYRL